MEEKSYRVLHLMVENYKRIKAADVTPSRNAVIVAGRNKQGKTSLLDAIAAVLGGKKQMASKPLRAGASDGQIVCVLGDAKPELLVKRVMTEDGKTLLEITSAEGYKAPSPQAILDSLCSAISFDPLSFCRMEPQKQSETLRRLVGLDFSEMEKQRKTLYDERTEVNRVVKSHAAQAAAIKIPDGTPSEEVSVAELMAEQQRRQEHNRRNQSARDAVAVRTATVVAKQALVDRLEDEMADMELRLSKMASAREDAWRELDQAVIARDAQEATVKVLEDQNVAEIQARIVESQKTNEMVRLAAAKASHLQQAEKSTARAAELTEQIDAIDTSKAQQLAGAKWPVEGLSFGEGGILYNGLPFDQASGAEQTEVSFAMAAAMNPQVRVALIRDASLLDSEQLEVVKGLAEKYDVQAWLEIVDDKAGPCGILIEDGTVIQPHTVEYAGTPEDAGGPLPSAAADDYAERRGTGVPEGEPADENNEALFME